MRPVREAGNGKNRVQERQGVGRTGRGRVEEGKVVACKGGRDGGSLCRQILPLHEPGALLTQAPKFCGH